MTNRLRYSWNLLKEDVGNCLWNSSELVCRHEFTQNVHLLTGTDDSEWNHICLERQQHLSQT